MNGPLQGLTVLDLTIARAGPTAVRLLSDWGADVIKVEMPSVAADEGFGPRAGSDFQNLHRNKRSITINLKDERGVELFKRLVRTADVVVENFTRHARWLFRIQKRFQVRRIHRRHQDLLSDHLPDGVVRISQRIA